MTQLGVTAEELEVAIKVGRLMSKTPSLYEQAEYRELRRAWGGVLSHQCRKISDRMIASSLENMAHLKQVTRQFKQKEDEEMLAKTQLRAIRMKQMKMLQQEGLEHCKVPDGAVDDGVNTSFGVSGGTENVVQVIQDKTTSPTTDEARILNKSKSCYTCRGKFQALHEFYFSLCPSCADLNFKKRMQTADLSGMVVLLTGGRIKIGYHTALKCLRMGATVLVTTRFPADAALRYSKENDFERFKDRLKLFSLDFRDISSVERFAASLNDSLDRLDVIINNACQTIQKPKEFYKHLVENEDKFQAKASLGGTHYQDAQKLICNDFTTNSRKSLEEPTSTNTSLDHFFPNGQLDVNGQQIDLRSKNSWVLTQSEVPTFELVEVLAVNTVAPFVLNAKLKDLMIRTGELDKTDRGRYIINVSAMEGKFYRYKNANHPHTNMAKSALNMMTRTSASDFAKYGIYMNSVDTGWINDENPMPIAARNAEKDNFQTPIDEIDAASRLVDPVISGVLNKEARVFGLFLKDYRETFW